MPKIYVKKAFKLRHNEETHDFPVGLHTVDAEVAAHWFVKAHTGEQPAVEPDARAAADALLAEIEAKAKALDDEAAAKAKALDVRAEELDAREKQLAKLEAAVDAHAADVAARDKAVTEREQAAEKAAAESAKSAKQSK